MALPIQHAPVLTGKAASDFIAKADYNAAHPGTTDFTEQFKTMRMILKKARL